MESKICSLVFISFFDLLQLLLLALQCNNSLDELSAGWGHLIRSKSFFTGATTSYLKATSCIVELAERQMQSMESNSGNEIARPSEAGDISQGANCF